MTTNVIYSLSEDAMRRVIAHSILLTDPVGKNTKARD